MIQALLQLEFCSRAVYQYFSVLAEVHQSLLAAPSKGCYFDHAIRGRFPRLISDFDAALQRAEISARCDQTQRASMRERDLPAHVVVYYVIALALYMRSSYREVLRCLLEGCSGYSILRPGEGRR